MKNPQHPRSGERNKKTVETSLRKIAGLLSAVVFCFVSVSMTLPAEAAETVTYCGVEEHTHTDACYVRKLICGKAEASSAASEAETVTIDPGHTHTDACYTVARELACGEEERGDVLAQPEPKLFPGHTHTDACRAEERRLICGEEEREDATAADGTTVPGHAHSDACYETAETFVCGEEEREDALIEQEPKLVPGHTHTDACYREARTLVCGEKEREPVVERRAIEADEGHTHTDACYRTVLTCKKTEHTHEEECFSDFNDIEYPSYWETTMPLDALTGNWADDLLLIAESQLGYRESNVNFKFDGVRRKGFTRYGAWYGSSHGDWCAMFASFCLHYAGIPTEAMPQEGGTVAWIRALKERGLFYEADASYFPQKGDLIFFTFSADRNPNHVGIVQSVQFDADGIRVTAIEGNANNSVMVTQYDGTDTRILGYGQLLQNPSLFSVMRTAAEAPAESEARPMLSAVSAIGTTAILAEPEVLTAPIEPVETLAEIETLAAPIEPVETLAEIETLAAPIEPVETLAEADTLAAPIEPVETLAEADTLAAPIEPVETLAEAETLAAPIEPVETLAEADTLAEVETLAAPDMLADTWTTLVHRGEDFDICVRYDDTAALPAGTQLVVTEIVPEAETFMQYTAAANEQLHKEELLTSVRFFDVTMRDEAGEEVLPSAESTVLVDVRLHEASSAEDGGVHVIRVAEAQAERAVPRTADAASERTENATFTAVGGRSVLGVVTTRSSAQTAHGGVNRPHSAVIPELEATRIRPEKVAPFFALPLLLAAACAAAFVHARRRS